MHIFNLPDLGEGLPDAEIHEWFVKEGEHVNADQQLVSMETAKAVVDVPSPQSGIVAKIYGKPGDIIKTGEPLIAFESDVQAPVDKGTVVGNLEESATQTRDEFIVGGSRRGYTRVKATLAVKSLAKKLNVDLQTISATGNHGMITAEDVQQAHHRHMQLPEGYEALKGVRRAMLHSMVQSHHEVVPVSIFDEADIATWPENSDITVRLIKAIIHASRKEPALNAWFDGERQAVKRFSSVHLGLAMDNEEGLFVPVIHHADEQSDATLRQQINAFKRSVQNRSISPDHLKGASITLSNFGKFSGRFASPIIVPPQVAILAVGRLSHAVVNVNQQLETHPILPLSLSFDHRAVTGGEATRFLGAVIESLQNPDSSKD